IWARGIKHPPHHVKVTVKKDSEGVVRAELFGKEFAIVKQKAQKKEDTSLMGKLKHKMGVTDEEEEEKPAEKKEAPKKEEKPAEKKEEKPVEKKEAPKKEEPKKEAAAPKPAHKAEPKQQTLAAEKPAKKD
ncbi:MAG: hypothetical protein KJ574_05120, partial [Nanoarchaeota archaeon]|nr:hypothetical protein [Nanoarchaeota archaeon]